MPLKVTATLATGVLTLAWSSARIVVHERDAAQAQRELTGLRTYVTELETRLAQLSRHAWDTVAEVPVRAAWETVLEARLTGEPERTAVVWVDLDRFKEVNDRHGHLAGDAVLRAVARRLEGAFSARAPVVTRLGGDEFGVVVRDLDTETDLARFTELMRDPVPLPHGRTIQVSASVGVARAAAGADRESLLRTADSAAYSQKQAQSDGVWRTAPSPRTRERTTALGAAR